MEESTIEKFKELYPDLCEAFSTIELEQLNLFAKKCTDYGLGNIAAGTTLKKQEDIDFSLMGIWFRISDKINRWKNIQFVRKSVNCESLLDTLQDIANYAIIAQLVLRGHWHDQEDSTNESSRN